MYPVLFSIGGFEITSFGVMLGVAALVALRVFRRELHRSDLPMTALDAAIGGLIGGLVGAKLIWAIEFRHEAPFLDLLLSRGGLSWFGGFLGGVTTGLMMLRYRALPILPVLAAAAPALAVGHALGRVGCFLVGDDYGRPSDLPWAVAFPNGLPPTAVPVHPTQLYETAALTALAAVVLQLRGRKQSDALVFGTYLSLAGVSRFTIELVRINAVIIGPFTLAQVFSLAVIAVGLTLIVVSRRAVTRSALSRQ